MAKKWIQAAHMKKGALHRQLGVPEGKPIPQSKLEAAEKKGGLVGKRAHLAETLRGLGPRGHSGGESEGNEHFPRKRKK